MQQRIKHYFGTTLGPFLKQSEIRTPKRKYTFCRIQTIVRTQSAVQTTRPHSSLHNSVTTCHCKRTNNFLSVADLVSLKMLITSKLETNMKSI